MRNLGLRGLGIILAAWLVVFSAWASAAVETVGKEEAGQWTRWVIPLPREMSIERKAVASAKEIAISVAVDAAPLVRGAADELAEALRQQTGAKIAVGTGAAADAAIEIRLGVCGKDGKLAGRAVPGAERLFGAACPEQAYRIVPLDDRTLALVGTRPEGVYYAAKTLKQLVSSASSWGGAGRVAVPLANVTDSGRTCPNAACGAAAPTRTSSGWPNEDFDSGAAQTKTWEVTKQVSGSGRYRVVFLDDSGWYGATIRRVALVSTPTGDPAKQTELARDVHQGVTGYQPKNTGLYGILCQRSRFLRPRGQSHFR